MSTENQRNMFQNQSIQYQPHADFLPHRVKNILMLHIFRLTFLHSQPRVITQTALLETCVPSNTLEPFRNQQVSWQVKTETLLTSTPQPTIPDFIHRDPSEFARFRLALCNLLPEDATKFFKYQVLVDHLKLMEARLIADSFLNLPHIQTSWWR